MGNETGKKPAKERLDHVKEWTAIAISLAALSVAAFSFKAQMIPDVEGTITVGETAVYTSSDIPSPMARVELDLFNYGNRPILLSSALLYIVPGDTRAIVSGHMPSCDLNQKNTDVLNGPDTFGPRSGWEPQAVDGQKVLPFVVVAPAFNKFEDTRTKSGLLCVMFTAYDTFGRRDTQKLPVGAVQFTLGKGTSEIRKNQLIRTEFLPRRSTLKFVDPRD